MERYVILAGLGHCHAGLYGFPGIGEVFGECADHICLQCLGRGLRRPADLIRLDIVFCACADRDLERSGRELGDGENQPVIGVRCPRIVVTERTPFGLRCACRAVFPCIVVAVAVYHLAPEEFILVGSQAHGQCHRGRALAGGTETFRNYFRDLL